MNKFQLIIVCCTAVVAFASCKKDQVVYRFPQPNTGQVVGLPGIAGSELGINAANSVFVDFSRGTVVTAGRTGWDLGFYPGDDFKVILNHSTGATAIQLNKTDLTQVGTQDSIANTSVLQLGTAGSSALIDPVTGNATTYLANILIKNIAATEAEAKVYLVNPGVAGVQGVIPTGGTIVAPPIRPWYKVKIFKGVNSYQVQAGRLGATQFNTVTIQKNTSFNFNFFSFVTLASSAEPAKPLWDIEWTWTTYQNAAGLPVGVNDFVLINFLSGVTVAQVKFDPNGDQKVVKNYVNFAAADLNSIPAASYLATRDAIGVNWRNIDPTTSLTSVYNDRFYIIKDTDGNIYKLRFNNSSNNDGGSQGRPVIEYSLLQATVPVVPTS
ncbi:HmuY family protein [Pedobacter cryoconitis]|uniref:Heme-binding HmuY-like protein n=1 Tax=Pedobacter cryoconitis TaxID=188932 RepID=A0A7X0J507_9SPHI|nr:HmuY family protein [Pedobacter cryoconitis]MBB6500784.1 hypothetical protein [Pedobacter cryoconitis]